MTAPSLTIAQVREMGLNEQAFQTMCNRLPGGDAASYTAAEMAAVGVPHDSIVWAFLRPDVLGSSFGETVCRLAETVLPAFEAARTGDTGPRDAIEAARRCFADPTPANRAAAAKAAYNVALVDEDLAYAVALVDADAVYAPWEARAASMAATAVASYAARAGTEYTLSSASEVVMWAGDAGCPRAKIISIIEGAGQ